MKQRWFEQEVWNEDIESFFWDKISRARKKTASQYIRIQAIILLESQDHHYQETAIRLMQHVFNDYSDSYMDVMFCHLSLADYYNKKQDFTNSYLHYETVWEYNQSNSNVKYCTIETGIGLVKTILQLHDKTKYFFAKSVLMNIFPYFKKRFSFLEKLREEYVSVCELYYSITKDSDIKDVIDENK